MSTQMSYVDQFWYARCLGVGENQVRVIKPLVGGGFGGKLDSYSFGLCAAKMSELTGRPVRMICLLYTSGGHGFLSSYF